MSDASQALNDCASDKRHPKAAEQLTNLAMPAAVHFGAGGWPQRIPLRRLTTFAVVGFWLFWYLAYTAYNFIDDPTTAPGILLPRVVLAGSGMAISFAIAWILEQLRKRDLVVRSVAALCLALVGTALHAFVTQEVRNFLAWPPQTSPLWVVYATDLIVRFWYFASIAAIILALGYVEDVKEREERIGALQALAHNAQLRALRNQLNPHFLFNALNSIAGLLTRDRNREAESMTENLADFLRATLALDPQNLITLGEESRLQRLYLEIEKVRFPDRLRVTFDIPASLESALVPSLITQPLVENSIKYAVARSTELVELQVRAAEAESHLLLMVEDSGGNADSLRPSKGGSIGLANVADRLRAHFGDDAEIEYGRTANGGFRNLIRIPIRRR